MHPPFSPRGENGPCTVQKTRQEGDFGLGPPLRRYDSRPVSGPSIVPLPRKSARFIRRRRRFADFPPPGPPLQTTQRGGHSPLFGNTPNGAAAGLKVGRFDKHLRNLRKRDNLRHKRGWTGALQRTRIRRGKIAESWLSTVASPNLPGRASLDQAAFSSTVHGPFFFAKTKENGGCRFCALLVYLLKIISSHIEGNHHLWANYLEQTASAASWAKI